MQTVPRASKKAAAQKESRLDPVVQRPHAEGQTETTAERDTYVASWRVDRTLQLAADMSNMCA